MNQEYKDGYQSGYKAGKKNGYATAVVEIRKIIRNELRGGEIDKCHLKIIEENIYRLSRGENT